MAGLALALALAVAAPVVSLAPGVVEAADEAREIKARALFTQGQYDKALELFSILYAETADPVYLRNLGRCHQMLRAPDPAIDAFRGYLRRGRKLRAGEREEVQGFIREMEALKQTQLAEAASAAEEAEKARLASESEKAERAKQGESARRPLPASAPDPKAGGSSLAVTETTPPPESPGLLSRWWFWTGVGAVLVGGATVFIATRRPVRPQCPDGAICP